MDQLTPLEKIPGLDEAARQKLQETYWITSAEELVGAAKADNATYGSGLAALGEALGKSVDEMFALLEAAQEVAPGASSFEGFAEMAIGDGLVLGDLSDIEAGAFATPIDLPDVVEPIAALPPPANQGKRNTCVAFTLAACFQALSGDTTDLSEQFLYWLCKSKDNIKGDVGTNPLLALKLMQEAGICSEATWPYKPAPVDNVNPGHEKPPEAAFQEARRRRFSGFKQLPGKDVNQIRKALAEKRPVLIGLPIWESWTSAGQARRLGKLRKELPGERRGGGHAMCVLGYRADETAPGGGYFIVRNSWGSEWAKENPDGPGYCRVPYQVVFEQGLIAFAVEGVAEHREEVAPTSGGSQRAAGLLGGSGEAGSLQGLYARAVAIQEQLSQLVADLAALAGGAGAEPATQPDLEHFGPSAPEGKQPATPAVEDATPPDKISSYSGPLIRIAEGVQGAGEELLTNGIDGVTGQYLLRIDAATASQMAGHGKEPEELKSALDAKVQTLADDFGVVGDVNPMSIRQSRWAVVVSANEDAGLLKAIWPLVQRRMEQMDFKKRDFDFRPGENCTQWFARHSDNMAKTLIKNWGEVPPVLLHRPGETVNKFLSRHGVSNGPVKPSMGVPYYLMLLSRPGPLKPGDTTFVGLNFQYELDIFFAVGRLCFTDLSGQYDLAAYSKYAERVAAFERLSDAASRVSKEVVYFGTKHKLDRSTIRSADELISPLVQWHTSPDSTPAQGSYGHKLYLEKDATRSNLEKILKGGDAGKPPALLFTASHGLGLPVSDERLVRHQGALVTQDWTGLGSIKREHWFAGEDLGDLNLEGTMAVLFACYGAGCPQFDEFVFDKNEGRAQVAPFPFIAQLPQKLLQSGCLAVFGHVERAWTHSFTGGEAAKAQTQPFEDIIARLMQGHPVGDALDPFNAIQGQRAARLASELEELEFGKILEPVELAQLWVARNDARNYALLGDPAVKVPLPPVPKPSVEPE